MTNSPIPQIPLRQSSTAHPLQPTPAWAQPQPWMGNQFNQAVQPTIRIHKFWTTYEDEYETERHVDHFGEEHYRARKTGKMREVHMVTYSPLGSDKVIMSDKVARLAKVGDLADAEQNPTIKMAYMRWMQIEPYYMRWLQGHAPTPDGVPLAAWPGVGPEQAEALRMRGISTVEQLAALNDIAIETMGVPNLRVLIENARRFLQAHEHTSIADKLAEKDAEIANLTESLRDMKDTVKEMAAMLAELREARQGPQQAVRDPGYTLPPIDGPGAGVPGDFANVVKPDEDATLAAAFDRAQLIEEIPEEAPAETTPKRRR